MKIADHTTALESWKALNDVLRSADEHDCARLLKAETKGKRRSQFIVRIHGRLDRVRRHRERKELLSKADART